MCSTKALFLRFCQSEKLQSVLDSPDEYDLIFVGVVEQCAGEHGCCRGAIEFWTTDMGAMEKEREEQPQGIEEAFKAQVEDWSGRDIHKIPLVPDGRSARRGRIRTRYSQDSFGPRWLRI